jgi:hypothetical protein
MNPTTRHALAQAGLSAGLIERMAAHQLRTSQPCPTCHAARGRTCIDTNGRTHVARLARES